MPGDVPGMGGMSTPADPDYGDSVSVAGTLGSKSDFDRRKKKRYLHGDLIALTCTSQISNFLNRELPLYRNLIVIIYFYNDIFVSWNLKELP